MSLPDAWKEVCLIGIIPEGSSTAVEFAGFTEDITGMDWGEKDIESMALVNGGRVVKYTPMTDEEFTLKVYDTRADDLATNSVVQLFHKQSTSDVTQPIVVTNTITRQSFGIILLWADTLPATSQTVPAGSAVSYRVEAINCYMTKYKPSYDDKIKSAEVTFKWAPFDQAAAGNKKESSTDGSVAIPAAITSSISF